MTENIIHQYTHDLSPTENGGEKLLLVTKFVPNGDPGVVLPNQQLILNSYGNSAVFELAKSPLTPAALRELADKLEAAETEARAKLAVPQS